MDYEEQINLIPFYQTHQEYKPFIGENYDKYRLLLIGESHYIGQTPKHLQFPLSYFEEHWGDGSCDELNDNYIGWYTTRSVINDYRTGIRHRGHSIFSNCIKSFSNIVLKQPIDRITTEESQKISYFTFMNFFQMPSLFKGMKFWNSLVIASEKDNAQAVKVWEMTVEKSSAVLDQVIDIMKPSVVLFVSKSAYDAYKGAKARHSFDNNIVSTCHPGCSHWYKKRKRDGLNGRDDFENYLREYVIKK